ncbi:MAG: hypothetical protein RSC23_16890 [Carnobacterium sp.]|uniref:hypothetical protein n=1 Tax=Carnobacterium sp. TaxID=48221 RepID=UPI002FC63A4D
MNQVKQKTYHYVEKFYYDIDFEIVVDFSLNLTVFDESAATKTNVGIKLAKQAAYNKKKVKFDCMLGKFIIQYQDNKKTKPMNLKIISYKLLARNKVASKDYGGMLLNDCFTKKEYQTVTEVNFIQEITSYCKENKMNAVYFSSGGYKIES